MDVNNGRILSLVTAPSYDPNKFWQYDYELFRGWYSQDLFEPGSTFKPINLALALEEKVCLLYTSPSPRDLRRSRMPSSA